MTKRKQLVIRCGVCGVRATKFIGSVSIPICDNPVCYHTRIDEVNKEIIEGNKGGNDVAYG